jgi:hypothetical protein
MYLLLLVASLTSLGQVSCGVPQGLDIPECNSTATPVACLAIGRTNQTFFSPTNSDLPEGTYIAASLTGALQLADYLDAHPAINVTNLLLSDSTVQDLATDFGYGDTYIDWMDPPSNLNNSEPDYDSLNRNISQILLRTIQDLDAVSSRIMDRVSPSLESLAYLNYIRIWGEYGRMDVPDNRTRNMVDREFPRLRSLTLRDQQWRFQNLPGRQTFFRRIPSLTHLHVISSSFPSTAVIRQSVPNATHIRISGNLPAELSARRNFFVQWTQSFMAGLRRRFVFRYFMQSSLTLLSTNSPVIIVQPTFNPMFQRGMGCGNPGLDYTCMLSVLARNRGVHLSLPQEEDYDRYALSYESLRNFPLTRAIVEFEDRLGGGEGEWSIPSKNDTLEYATASLHFCSGY